MDPQAYVNELCSRYGTAAHIPFVEFRPSIGDRRSRSVMTTRQPGPG